MNLEKLSLAELRQLQKDLPAEIQRRETMERKSVVAELRALAAARGFDYEELVAGTAAAPAAKPRKPVAAKYRHPQDATLAWTGRGRKPAWVADWLASGKPLEALVVE
jgi:DNA-binding protein H-NS